MEEDINVHNFRGILIKELRKVLEQLHPSLTAHDAALYYVENLCLRLLTNLCTDTPHTIQDVEEKVIKTFPTPIDKWALADARETIDKSKRKKPVLPVDRLHQMLQKELLQYKIDNSVSLFLVAVLEYISADILKLAGNYVKMMKHIEITQEDVQIAIRADSVLMDMFYQGENGHSIIASPLPPTPRDGLTYEEVVKELLHDEKQYLRDLHMIIRVFREELIKIVDDPCELDPIFSNIIDIYELSVTLLGSLEDVIEMSQEQSTPCVGSCFEELAEAAEFDVYITYANEVTSQHAKDALTNLLARPKAQSLIASGHGFTEAVRYYLPKLLLTPIGHTFVYMEYVDKLLQLSQNNEDKESLDNVKGLFEPLKFELHKQIPLLPKESLMRTNSRVRRQQAIEKTKELQSTVEHWDKDIGQCCNEFIREDTLMMLIPGKRITERKVFLFDGLLGLCKANTRKQTVSGVTNNYDFRRKEKFFMRKVNIIDRVDSDELKNAFEIAPREDNSVVLIAKHAQHKNEWMADLVMLNTKSMLERILDSILLDIEKQHPLRLPSPEIYKFSEPDSPSNIVLEEKESAGVPLIRGATLIKLVERLTYHIYADPAFVRTLLTTFRSFCSAQELLQLLIERFDIPDPSSIYETNDRDSSTTSSSLMLDERLHKSIQREDWKRYRKEYMQPVQFRVINVLRHWVDQHYYDFERDPSLLQKLQQFLESIKGKSMRKWVDSVLKIVQRKADNDENHRPITFNFGHSPPAIEYHLQVSENEYNLLTLHPIELARQLTLIEFELYRNVKPSELVGAAFTKKDKEKTSPNLLKIIRHTNNFTNWIIKSIVEAENLEERVAIYSRAIEVMTVLIHKDINNFNGVLTITGAFNSASVNRLCLTRSQITKALEKTLSECLELSENHMRKYQEKLKSINPPCVPFLGIYMTNILKIEDGNTDFLKDSNLINFSKRRRVAEITGEIQQYQNQPYCLKVDPKIRRFIETLDPFPDMNDNDIQNYCYEQSLKIEPKNGTKMKFPRKWPRIELKSPGTKPRQTKSNSSFNTLPFGSKASSQAQAASEGNQQSPTATSHQLSSSDFSVFANVHIPVSMPLSQSTSSSFTYNTSHAMSMQDDTISIVSTSTIVPPRRYSTASNPTSHINSSSYNHNHSIVENKPLLSPRMHATSVSPGRPFNDDDQASPSSYRPNPYQRAGIRNPSITNESSSPGYHPGSPRYAPEISNENGHHHQQPQQPISPHVNVPPNANNFNHIPPPIPPRRPPKKNSYDFYHSQMRQNPDAPILLPRDIDPPALPPRTHHLHQSNQNSNTWNHLNQHEDLPLHGLNLRAPDNSSLIQRRNSELNRENQAGTSSGTQKTPPPASTSSELKNSFGDDKKLNSPRSQSETTPKLPPRNAPIMFHFPPNNENNKKSNHNRKSPNQGK